MNYRTVNRVRSWRAGFALVALASACVRAEAEPVVVADDVQSGSKSELDAIATPNVGPVSKRPPHADRWVLIDGAGWRAADASSLLEQSLSIGAGGLYLYNAGETRRGAEFPASVRSELGGADGLRIFAENAALRGLGLHIDVELNHVPTSSPLVRNHPDWFHRVGPLRDYQDPQQLLFGDLEGSRDFAQEQPEVSAFLIGATLDLVARVPLAGLGLRSVRHVPVPFWAELVWASIEATAGRLNTVGSYFTGDARELARVFRQAGFSHAFDYPMHFALLEVGCDAQDPERIASVLTADSDYDDPSRLVTLLGRPGEVTLEERCGADERLVRRMLALQHGLRGTPAVMRETLNCEAPTAGCTAKRREHLRELLAIRERHPVLHDGETRVVAAGQAGLLLLRLNRERLAVVLYNASLNSTLTVPLPLGVPTSALVDSYGLELVEGQLRAEAGSSGIAVFRRPSGRALEWSEPTARRVEISVEGLPERVERLVLVGDSDALGTWDPEQGVKMEKRAGVFYSALPLPRGSTAHVHLVAISGEDEELEGMSRYVFVDYQRGPLRLRWSWRSADIEL
ncbi:MAG: hypothetical protein AAF219_01635 [Myxococcota bacterium]